MPGQTLCQLLHQLVEAVGDHVEVSVRYVRGHSTCSRNTALLHLPRIACQLSCERRHSAPLRYPVSPATALPDHAWGPSMTANSHAAGTSPCSHPCQCAAVQAWLWHLPSDTTLPCLQLYSLCPPFQPVVSTTHMVLSRHTLPASSCQCKATSRQHHDCRLLLQLPADHPTDPTLRVPLKSASP